MALFGVEYDAKSNGMTLGATFSVLSVGKCIAVAARKVEMQGSLGQ